MTSTSEGVALREFQGTGEPLELELEVCLELVLRPAGSSEPRPSTSLRPSPSRSAPATTATKGNAVTAWFEASPPAASLKRTRVP